MKNRAMASHWLSGIVGCLMMLSALNVAAENVTENEDPFMPAAPGVTQAYSNYTLFFTLKGPEGWASLTQREDEHGKPHYPLPPGVRCVFRKSYHSPPMATSFSSTLTLTLGSSEGKTALEQLRAAEADAELDMIVASAKEVTLGQKRWATIEVKQNWEESGTKLLGKRKVYLLIHEGAELLIEGESPADEYAEDVPLFDHAITTMQWYKNKDEFMTGLVEDASKYLLQRQQETIGKRSN